MLVSDTGCCAQKMMKHSKKQGAPRIGRTLKNPHTIETPVSLQHWSSWWARVDYASRASKKAPQGPFCRRDVWRRPMLFESTLGYALKSFGQKRNSSIFTTLEFLVGAGGFEQLAFTHTYTGELKNHRRQATFHFTQDSLKQQCAQFCA